MGIVQGADVTVGQFIYKNLIPATIGNWIGGAFMVGALSAGIHGSPGARAFTAWERAAERVAGGVQRTVEGCLPSQRRNNACLSP